MLNNCKIGTKLTLGFLLVLGLLIVTAGVAYNALHASRTSSDTMMEEQDEYAEMQHYNQLLFEAQLYAARGSLFRDLGQETKRQEVDKKIKKIEEMGTAKFSGEDAKHFAELVKTYAHYVSEDTSWYRIEEQRVKGQMEITRATETLVADMEKCIKTFSEEMNATQTGEGKETKVDYVFTRNVVVLEECIAQIYKLSSSFFRLKAEPNHENSLRIFEEIKSDVTTIEDHLAAFEQNLDSEHQHLIDHVIELIDEWFKMLTANIELVNEQSRIDTAHEQDSKKMTGILEVLMKDLHAHTEAIRQQSETTDARMVAIVEGTTLFAVILGVFISIVLGRNISVGISATVKLLSQVANEGVVTIGIPDILTARKDEVGNLAHAAEAIVMQFRNVDSLAGNLANGNYNIETKVRGEQDTMNVSLNKMLDQVNEALSEINDCVGQVTTGSAEVSTAAQSLSDGAQTAAASIEEISASMHEISSQTKSNAEHATQAKDLTNSVCHVASQGQIAMQDMNESMDRITQNSVEIQRVIKVVDDIAFQTNLLALNAAVEAARAGQHGKGFAVVAEEVRNLASRSAQAAQETAALIAKSSHEIEKGGEAASHTVGVFDTIVEQIKQTSDLVSGIALASNEQAHGVGQISLGLNQIDSVTQQNTACAEQSAGAANEMSAMAKKLQTLVARFHLRSQYEKQ